jgi:hypothetical protein
MLIFMAQNTVIFQCEMNHKDEHNTVHIYIYYATNLGLALMSG